MGVAPSWSRGPGRGEMESLAGRQGRTHPSPCAHFPQNLLSSGLAQFPDRVHVNSLLVPFRSSAPPSRLGWGNWLKLSKGEPASFPSSPWLVSLLQRARVPGLLPRERGSGSTPGSAAPQMTGCELSAAWGGRLGAMSHRLGSRVQARTAPLTQAAGWGGRCCCQGNSGPPPWPASPDLGVGEVPQ